MASDSQDCNFESLVKRLKFTDLSQTSRTVAELESIKMRLTAASGSRIMLEFFKAIVGQDEPSQKVFELDLGKVPLSVRFKGNEVHFHWASGPQHSELSIDLPGESLDPNFEVR
jgi:hypothetical protein